jgi:hypothetical protein
LAHCYPTDGGIRPRCPWIASTASGTCALIGRRRHRVIEIKIGEELRERYKPPQELPHNMLALLTQPRARDETELGAASVDGLFP